MKIKKLIGICAIPALLFGSAIALLNAKPNKAESVAATDCGAVTITGLHSASSASALYLLHSGGDGLAVNWDDKYSPVDSDSGIYINGVRQSSIDFKHPNIGIDTFYYGLPSAAAEGDVLEIKGTFVNSNDGDTFTMNYYRIAWVTVDGTAKWIKDYDITFSGANADSVVTYMFGVCTTTNDLDAGWSTSAFAPMDADSGTFVEGTRVGAEIKKITSVAYYISVPGTTTGTIATVKGTWVNSLKTARITIKEFVMQWNGSKWDYAIEEDYDVVSFKDANIPDFENVAVNTEDAAAYAYTTGKGTLPKRNGYFGLTNETGSYVFQFNFEVTSTMSNWVEIRIGASGGWGSGHVLKYQFTNQWNDGVLIVSERVNDSVYDGHTKEVRTNIEGGVHTMECAAIKVLGDNNLYYVYFKNNGTVAFSAFWELSPIQRSNRVGIYAPDTCFTLSNSIEPAVTTTLTLAASNSGSAMYFNTTSDSLPFVHTWSDYFIPQDSTGFTYNGVDASSGKVNYFKKVGYTGNSFYFNFADQGITPVRGDYFHLGGIFKQVHIVNDVAVLYKIVVQDCDFQFDGTKWVAYNPDYTAEDFAKDLLKLTLSICSAASDGNHDALASVWIILANDSHFGSMQYSQQDLFKNGSAGAGISVPTTSAGIDAMSSSDAIGGAIYRYDYCTAKYSLTNFANRSLTVSFASNYLFAINVNSQNSFIVIFSILSVVVVSAFGYYFYIKKREKNF